MYAAVSLFTIDSVHKLCLTFQLISISLCFIKLCLTFQLSSISLCFIKVYNLLFLCHRSCVQLIAEPRYCLVNDKGVLSVSGLILY